MDRTREVPVFRVVCNVERVEGVEVLRPAGGLDAFTAGRMRRVFDVVPDGDSSAVIVDLTRVDFLDSAGLGLLVGLASRARARGVVLALAVPRPWVRGFLHNSGFDRIATIASSLKEAIETIGRHSPSQP
jgi:anti-sigma B factor antagonist